MCALQYNSLQFAVVVMVFSYVLLIWCLKLIRVFYCFQLIFHIEEEGLDTEGLLRIPGSATRVKVIVHHC